MHIRRNQYLVLISLLTFVLHHSVFSQPAAFPGAEGFGSSTVGGRGGKVIKVTSLDDSGPGSLREALKYEGPSMIVFATGGIINLETKLYIRSPFVTIAGQTAPGGGICIRGNGLVVQTHDVVLRYLRIRPGEIDFGSDNDWSNVDAISLGSASFDVYNVVIDHCSLSWAVDEVVGMWHRVRNVTIQHSIISEALHQSKHPKGYHGMGLLAGQKTANISLHHNLFAHNNDRNPLLYTQGVVDFRNNVIYNPGGVAADFTGLGTQKVNFVNNYIVDGPSTRTETDIILRERRSNGPKFYIDSNISTKKIKLGYQDDWYMVKDYYYAPVDEAARAPQAFAHPEVTTHDATAALNYVIENVGATLPKRDPVDKKLMNDVLNRVGGLLNHKGHPLEWPPLSVGSPPADTDNDGMPDYWEESFNLDVFGDDAHQDPDQDQYLNIEEYCNGTNPLEGGTIQTLSTSSARVANPSPDTYTYQSFSIEQNYPNPIQETTQLAFEIDKPSPITLHVIDMYGKVVADLVSGFLYEGKYYVRWDSTPVNSGIYHIVLSSRDKIRSIKAVVSH